MYRILCCIPLIAASLAIAGETGTADLLVLSSPGFPSMMMLGPAGCAIGTGPGSMLSNPSLCETGFSAAGGRWNLETTAASVAGAFSAGSDIEVGTGLVYLGRGGLIGRDESGVVTGEYSYSTGCAMAGVSFPLAGWIDAGISAGLSWENVAAHGGTGITANAGLAFRPAGGLLAGIVITGVGQAPSWQGISKDMPTEISAGASYSISSLITGFAGGKIGLSTSDAFGCGISVSYAEYGCSAGYRYSPGEEEISGFFAGLRYTYESGGSYTVEIATEQRDELDWPVLAGLSVSL